MNIINRLSGICFVTILVLYLLGCTSRTSQTPQDNPEKEESSKMEENKSTNRSIDNFYVDLRNQALSTTSDQLQLDLPNDESKVYGMVMDWNLGEGIATLVAFQTGDASYYLSTGGGIIGGGSHEKVSKATDSFIKKAQTYLKRASKTDFTPVPDPQTVKFVFLTNKGKFVAQEHIEKFEDGSSEWIELFESANTVITELRQITETNENDK